eukprot:15445007-Alexandrium_andersonii.AAC.1
MAAPPRGRGWTTSTDAHWGPFRGYPKGAPCHGRERSDRATWGPLCGAQARCAKTPSHIVRA